MNENNILNQLVNLRKLKPSDEDMSFIEKKVFTHLKKGKSTLLLSPLETFLQLFTPIQNRQAFLYSSIIVLFILFFAVLKRDEVRSQSQIWIIQTQIALTSNKFEKAKLALISSQNQLEQFKKSSSVNLPSQTRYIAKSTSQANTYLDSLNLKGESGKYTNQQCLGIYSDYYKYIGELKIIVNDKINKTKDDKILKQLLSLQKQISVYETEAETKLKLY